MRHVLCPHSSSSPPWHTHRAPPNAHRRLVRAARIPPAPRHPCDAEYFPLATPATWNYAARSTARPRRPSRRSTPAHRSPVLHGAHAHGHDAKQRRPHHRHPLLRGRPAQDCACSARTSSIPRRPPASFSATACGFSRRRRMTAQPSPSQVAHGLFHRRPHLDRGLRRRGVHQRHRGHRH